MNTVQIHRELRIRHPKTGRCEECGATKSTDWCFMRHPEPHTLDIADYREQCRSCHTKLDALHRRIMYRLAA